MTRDAVTRALTDEVLREALDAVHQWERGRYVSATSAGNLADLRERLTDALSRAGLLAASPPGAREERHGTAVEALREEVRQHRERLAAMTIRYPVEVEIGSGEDYARKVFDSKADIDAFVGEERPTPPAERETPAPVTERGWALRRKDDPAAFWWWSPNDADAAHAALWPTLDALWADMIERTGWEPVYVTRSVTVSVSPEAPAQEKA